MCLKYNIDKTRISEDYGLIIMVNQILRQHAVTYSPKG